MKLLRAVSTIAPFTADLSRKTVHMRTGRMIADIMVGGDPVEDALTLMLAHAPDVYAELVVARKVVAAARAFEGVEPRAQAQESLERLGKALDAYAKLGRKS